MVFSALVSQVPVAPAPTKSTASIEGLHAYVLPNGLQVLLIPDESSQTVTSKPTVLAGSRVEGPFEKGMSHMLEHMLLRGTPAHPDLKKAWAARGAVVNGSTNEDNVTYYVTLPASDANTDWLIRVDADRLVNSQFSAQALEGEKTVLQNEFDQSSGHHRYSLESSCEVPHFAGTVTGFRWEDSGIR
jgi:zinc protease